MSESRRSRPEIPELFDPLEPPRDGLAMLRARLDRSRRSRFRLRAIAAGAGAVALTALIVAVVGGPFGQRSTPGPDPFRMIRISAGLQGPPTEAVTILAEQRNRSAVARVETRDPSIVFYRVGSISE